MKTREFLSISFKGGLVIALALAAKVIIGAGTQILLARLLEPEVFGNIAFASTVAMLFNALTNLKGDTYVIQQNESPRRAVDVVFTLELISATFFMLLVFLVAPALMRALGKTDLTLYVQLLSLSFLYNPFVRPRSLMERNLFFARAKFPLIGSEIVAAIISIALAYQGLGIWSLVAWRLIVPLGEALILWIISDYRPRLRWNREIATRSLRFSLPLTASGFLVFFYYNVDYFIIGQFLPDGATQLGYYWLGFQVSSYVLMGREVLYGVLFPLFSRVENTEFKRQVFIRLSGAVTGIFLVLTIFALSFGEDIILLVYGDKWAPAVFPFQVIFIVVLMRAINSNTGYFFHSSGKTIPDFVSAMMFSVLLPPLAYVATMNIGINGTALAVLAIQVIVNVIIYERYVKPMTGHGVLHFFLWPWVISGMGLTVAVLGQYWHISLVDKALAFVVLLVITSIFVLRHVIRDFRLALRILKPTSSEGVST